MKNNLINIIKVIVYDYCLVVTFGLVATMVIALTMALGLINEVQAVTFMRFDVYWFAIYILVGAVSTFVAVRRYPLKLEGYSLHAVTFLYVVAAFVIGYSTSFIKGATVLAHEDAIVNLVVTGVVFYNASKLQKQISE